MAFLRKAVAPTLAALSVSMLLGGCKFFDLSNPLIPKARLYAETGDTSMITVDYTYKLSDNTIDGQAKETTIKVNSYPGDGTPGVYLNAYSAEYLDQAGKAIPTITLTKVNFGISQYVPPASGQTPSSVSLQLPIYNQQVYLYGVDQVFSQAGGVTLNRNLIHTINCAVTLYGEDDNFNEIQVTANVPIRFSGKVTQ